MTSIQEDNACLRGWQHLWSPHWSFSGLYGEKSNPFHKLYREPTFLLLKKNDPFAAIFRYKYRTRSLTPTWPYPIIV